MVMLRSGITFEVQALVTATRANPSRLCSPRQVEEEAPRQHRGRTKQHKLSRQCEYEYACGKCYVKAVVHEVDPQIVEELLWVPQHRQRASLPVLGTFCHQQPVLGERAPLIALFTPAVKLRIRDGWRSSLTFESRHQQRDVGNIVREGQPRCSSEAVGDRTSCIRPRGSSVNVYHISCSYAQRLHDIEIVDGIP
eukprot:scaffold28556_cov27-Tisochrysis_lutea.AAC.2